MNKLVHINLEKGASLILRAAKNGFASNSIGNDMKTIPRGTDINIRHTQPLNQQTEYPALGI
jgi:hypothetical protein